MAEYIERDAFKRKLYEANCVDKYGFVMCGITKINILLEQSAADVVEVVRCKDCIYATDEGKLGHCCRQFPYGGMAGLTEDNDFCSYAERRTNNGE